ncbi:MAG: LysR substrate-binding domain-containing protein [Gammaproteobacteria bacterium]|nr:LysR substrate-binding domain-containing protein [Gammaproteobacteria bacterium]
MTLTELRYIVAVARERHFGHAAKSCFVTQPTLSLGIKKLEEELGSILFERGAKNEVRTTAVGERVIHQAQKVLEEADAIKGIAEFNSNPLAGTIRLGVIYSIAPYLLPKLIPIIHQDAPKMPLLIEENYTSVLLEQLKQGKLDVIVIALPFNEPGVVTHAVYDEPFVIATPRVHKWNVKSEMHPSELVDENLLLLGPGHCFRDQVLKICPQCNQQSGNKMQDTLQGSSLETMAHMVATGVGVTVLPCSSAASHVHAELLSMISFSEPQPYRRVALAWRKTYPRPQAIEALRQAILHSEVPCVKTLPDEQSQAY